MADFNLKIPSSRELTGGDLLAQSLEHIGVKIAFGLHGGHLDAFLIGCQATNISLIDTRHETVAVQAAEAYAKFSGKIGVCFVTANSGFSNGIPGLATALGDRSPILCITSSPPLRDAETNCLQGILDQVVAARPFTKFAYRVTNAGETPRLVAHAIRVALSGAPGPVLLDFPIDVLFSPVHQPSISWGAISSPLFHGPGVHTEVVAQVLDLLKSASRPVVIVGSGVNSPEARDKLIKFSRHYWIPIFDTMKCRAFPIHSEVELFGGPAERLALLPHLKKERPDIVLILGARTGMFLGGRSGSIIPPDCKIIHVDVDGSEIGRILPVTLGAVCEAEQFLAALNSRFKEFVASNRLNSNWANDILSLKFLPSPFENEPEYTAAGILHPYHALKKLFSAIEPGSIIILDGGDAGLWGSDAAGKYAFGGVAKATGNLGFLGNGFGYALGAAIARPDTKIVSIHGDGSAGFHLMDVDTYKRFNLNIMTVVVNNYCWGMSQNGQDIIYGDSEKARPATVLSPGAEYDLVASGLGNASVRVDKIDEINEQIGKLGSVPGPSLVNLIVDSKPAHPTTVALVGKTDDPAVVVVPYYSNIPKPSYPV